MLSWHLVEVKQIFYFSKHLFSLYCYYFVLVNNNNLNGNKIQNSDGKFKKQLVKNLKLTKTNNTKMTLSIISFSQSLKCFTIFEVCVAF